jgi:hypothetical protein
MMIELLLVVLLVVLVLLFLVVLSELFDSRFLLLEFEGNSKHEFGRGLKNLARGEFQ